MQKSILRAWHREDKVQLDFWNPHSDYASDWVGLKVTSGAFDRRIEARKREDVKIAEPKRKEGRFDQEDVSLPEFIECREQKDKEVMAKWSRNNDLNWYFSLITFWLII